MSRILQAKPVVTLSWLQDSIIKYSIPNIFVWKIYSIGNYVLQYIQKSENHIFLSLEANSRIEIQIKVLRQFL